MCNTIESYCGMQCSKCNGKKDCSFSNCAQLNNSCANKDCAVAKCVQSRGIRFCGECGDFPCNKLQAVAADKQKDSQQDILENCKQIKLYLVAKARKGTDSISICGHHCDFCFMGQWCGGCRSDYNCCSFATIFEDNKCPNVKCAKEKNIDGCYMCKDLYDCTKGFYGNENQFAAKAAALFIKKYSKDKYTKTLKTATDKGFSYADDLDKSGSVQNALELLEKYL